MRVQRFTTVAELVGAALIVTGVALVWIPAALIVAGLLAFVFSWAVSRHEAPAAPDPVRGAS